MKKIFLLSLVALAGCGRVSAPSSSSDNGRGAVQVQTYAATCDQIQLSRGPLTYCIEDQSPANSFLWTNLVYFFHGLSGRPDALFSPPYSEIIERTRAKLGSNAPIFISLSLGPEGIVKEDADEILRVAIPAIEKKISHGWILRRHLIGESMGGHNSLRVAAASPLVFKSLSLLCPALITFDPNDESQVQRFIDTHRDVLSLGFFNYLREMFRREFPTPESWQANEPFHFLTRGDFRFLPTFVSIGRSDNVGFYDGAKAWVDRTPRSSMRSVWAPVDGAHCAFDSEALVQFLVGTL